MDKSNSNNGILEKIKIVDTEKGTNKVDKSNSFNFTWIVGDEIEAKDFMKKWYRARIMARNKKHGGRILVHFQGWSTQYDEWLPVDSDRIRPIMQSKKELSSNVTKVEIGTIVYAPWRDGRIYPGKIIHSTRQSCFVRFYDGMCRKLKSKFIFLMNDKEKDDYLKEGYFKGSIFSLPSKLDLIDTCKKNELNQNNLPNKKIGKMLFKKSKFCRDFLGKHKLELTKRCVDAKREPELCVGDSDGCSDYKKFKTDLSSNSMDSKSSKKRKNCSATKKSELFDKDSGPKVRCSFCQNYHDRFVSRPALNAMTQCYICIDCKLEYDERLRANHLQSINDWLITGKLPSFHIETNESKSKKKEDSTIKDSNEVIMKATNDVIAEITNIQKTLSYIDQAILLLKDETHTEALHLSLLKISTSTAFNNSKSTITQNLSTQYMDSNKSVIQSMDTLHSLTTEIYQSQNLLKSSHHASLHHSGFDSGSMKSNFVSAITPIQCYSNSESLTNYSNNQNKTNTYAESETSPSISEPILNKSQIDELVTSIDFNTKNSSYKLDDKLDDNKDKLILQSINSSGEDPGNVPCKKSLFTVDNIEKHAEISRKIKAELARMQAELARKILSIDSTVGVLEVGVEHNNSNGRENFQKTLGELNDLALIANFI